jgi:3-aminobutyryl-CoA ammonia-lyase
MRFEARKVIRAAPQINDSAAEVLDPPIIVCRAKGTCVTPMEKQRGSKT